MSLAILIRHELEHTPDYGTPTGSAGGYGNGLCAHVEIAERDVEFGCELVSGLGGDGAEPVKDALCKQLKNWGDATYNTSLARSVQCPGGPFGGPADCPACD